MLGNRKVSLQRPPQESLSPGSRCCLCCSRLPFSLGEIQVVSIIRWRTRETLQQPSLNRASRDMMEETALRGSMPSLGVPRSTSLEVLPEPEKAPMSAPALYMPTSTPGWALADLIASSGAVMTFRDVLRGGPNASVDSLNPGPLAVILARRALLGCCRASHVVKFKYHEDLNSKQRAG